MIVEPNVQELLKRMDVDSRYTLVVAVAKRARHLAEGNPDIDKTVSIAVKEIANGKITVRHPEEAEEDDVYAAYANGDKG